MDACQGLAERGIEVSVLLVQFQFCKIKRTEFWKRMVVMVAQQ